MIPLLMIAAGTLVEAAGLLGWRNRHAGLLVGIGGIIVGIARPGPLGAVNIALGVLGILQWWNRRRRDRAPRAIGGKARAIIAAMTAAMRKATPRLARTTS